MTVGPTALITGITGQDGAYLAHNLLGKGYRVVGGVRRSASLNKWRLIELGIADAIEFLPLELSEPGNIRAALQEVQPDEIYNLAAQSFVADSFRQPLYTADVDGIATLRLLEGLREVAPSAKFYQASTSEMFGKVREVPQTETTPFYPRSPYGTAKVFAHWTTVNYRESYGLFCVSGILFNHESPFRGPEFLTRKVSLAMARLACGLEGVLKVGNLDARRDWGYAPDYVEGMWRMLQAPSPSDFVLATGRATPVRTFVELAAGAAGFDIDWVGTGKEARGIDRASGRIIVEVDPRFFRPAEVDHLIGSPGKALKELGWSCPTGVERLAALMVEADIDRVRRGSLSAS